MNSVDAQRRLGPKCTEGTRCWRADGADPHGKTDERDVLQMPQSQANQTAYLDEMRLALMKDPRVRSTPFKWPVQ